VISARLLQQLKDAFGIADEAGLSQLLDRLRADGHGDLADGLGRFFAAAARSYGELDQAASVRSQAQWFRLALRIAGAAPFDWNPLTGAARFIAAWKGLLGFAPDELEDTQRAWLALIHEEDAPLAREHIGAHLAGRTPFIALDYRLRTKGGEWTWLLLRAQVAERDGEGRPTRVMGIHQDIAARKRWEQDLLQTKAAVDAANRTKSQFIANMSHEVRTPMNAIIGMTELTLATRLDAEQRQYLTAIRSSAHSLLDIVNDILDFSKIEAGKMAIEQVEFSLRGVVRETVKALALRAQEKGLELIYGVRADVPERLFGDAGRLRQVLTNLMANAVKFTDKGEVELNCEVDQRAVDAFYLRFSVRDTGIGIAADQQREIFEAFAQADSSTTRRFGGTGLGLAICTRLVALMDGRIWVESEPGKGSTFLCTMRLGLGKEAGSDKHSGKDSPLAGRRVLVVDDNAAAARHLARHVEEWGMTAALVHGGRDAIAEMRAAALEARPYSLVLLDGSMPPPDGFAVLEACRDGEPGAARIIMLLAMKSQREDAARARELGVKHTLVKPISQSDLLDAAMLALGLAGRFAFEVDSGDLEATLRREENAPAEAMEILLVEDNPVNQMLAQRLLEKAGHRVTLANNGQEAIEQFETKRFDAILMDVQMPVMGGLEATEAIRARELRRSWIASGHPYRIPIIAMTAHAMAGDRERCLEAGMDDYVSKPIQPSLLMQALQNARQGRADAGDDSLGRWFNSSIG
jgi:two-component system, sensor histidine kinase and response regulator